MNIQNNSGSNDYFQNNSGSMDYAPSMKPPQNIIVVSSSDSNDDGQADNAQQDFGI